LKIHKPAPATKVTVTDLSEWPDPADRKDLVERSLALL